MATKPWGVQNAANSNTAPTLATLQAYTAEVGAMPRYAGWAHNFAGAGTAYVASEFTTVLNAGITPVLTWTPNDNSLSLHISNTDVTGGTYDALIDSYANGIKALSGTVHIRFAHEANGSWYDWSPGLNGNTAASYIAMWRYVWNRFQSAGCTNVKWVWCVNTHASSENTTNWTTIYPGDAYVDIIAVDGYNYGETNPHVWQDWTTVFASSLIDLKAVTANKPVAIAEMGSVESISTHSKAAWITDALNLIQQDTRISFFIWFDSNSATGDMRINTSVAATTAFTASIAVVKNFSLFSV